MKTGFARLKETDPTRLHEICSRGGKASHLAGGHKFSPEEARAAAKRRKSAADRTLPLFPDPNGPKSAA